MSYTVYMHITPSGKMYIGITGRNPLKRWGSNGSGYKGQAFSNAIKKYGWDNMEHKILYTNLSKEEAEKKEIELIARYNTTNSNYGYNVENGGSSVGKFSEETKAKISKSKIGSVPWNKGVPRTDEEKRKMSLSHIGKTVGEKNGNYGKHFSEEHRRKISEAKKGHQSTFKGMHHSQRTKDKLSAEHSKPINRIEDGKTYKSIKEASKDIGISSTAICNCLKGKTKSAGGYHWEYAQN